MNLRLAGKRALVTGSSSGIGTGIARMLAAEGVRVVVTGRDHVRVEAVAQSLRESGGDVVAVVGDLSSDVEAANVALAALTAFGGIDILVNNAGGGSQTENRGWFGTTPDDWLESYERNMVSAVRMAEALVPGMKTSGWGRVINISTAAALTPTSAQADYGPAKLAMLSWSLGLSKALSMTGVTCNAVSPGMIRTEGLEKFLSYFAAKRGWGDDIRRAADYVAQGGGQTVSRIGEIDDIAYAVTMLASPLSDFINGTNIHVDGGLSRSVA
ncbi:MAG: SDR family oxidoreductase [Pseudomonadota bacterium]